jgi:hypothetical protein
VDLRALDCELAIVKSYWVVGPHGVAAAVAGAPRRPFTIWNRAENDGSKRPKERPGGVRKKRERNPRVGENAKL